MYLENNVLKMMEGLVFHYSDCRKTYSFIGDISKKIFGWGFATDPTGGAYDAPPDP